MLRQTHKRSYTVTTKQVMTSQLNNKVVQTVKSLMVEDKARTQAMFDKVAPLINEIFSVLANYDIRFEFYSLSLDSCQFEKVAENEFNVLCPLKELPEEDLRLERQDTAGVLTVRLSRTYKDSIDKVSWEDIALPADSKGCRYFSTKLLLKVLMRAMKHAINDVIARNEEKRDESKSATCKLKNNTIVLEAKLPNHCVQFNLLPCIALNRQIMKSLTMDRKISWVEKNMRLKTSESAFLVAKPLADHPETLWRITANNLENHFVSKIFDVTECGSYCFFALTLISEQFFAEKKNKGMVSYFLIRMALLEEFLKLPNVKFWRFEYFSARVESLLRSLEDHVCRRDFKNIFTGGNIIRHFKNESLAELCSDIARVREHFGEYFS